MCLKCVHNVSKTCPNQKCVQNMSIMCPNFGHICSIFSIKNDVSKMCPKIWTNFGHICSIFSIKNDVSIMCPKVWAHYGYILYHCPKHNLTLIIHGDSWSHSVESGVTTCDSRMHLFFTCGEASRSINCLFAPSPAN